MAAWSYEGECSLYFADAGPDFAEAMGTASGSVYGPSACDHVGDVHWPGNFAGPRSGTCDFDGCESVLSEGTVSVGGGIPDDSDYSHCTIVCIVVRVWNLEQGVGDGTYDIFPDYNHSLRWIAVGEGGDDGAAPHLWSDKKGYIFQN